MLLDAVTVFLGAFLLFQIQPIIAARILPWFGGAAGVWSACMLFFQVMLLAGYAYAHALVRWTRPRTQKAVHGALLLASLAFLPVIPSELWKPGGSEDPVLRIVLLLLVTLGLPYVLLSTTGPLIQTWLVGRLPAAEPYRLFALGNLAALLALLAYPVAVQPHLAISGQLRAWSLVYGLYALLSLVLAVRAGRARPPAERTADDAISMPAGDADMPWLLWTALAACASVLLLAVTNYLTKDIAPIPFLWVLPLTLYLLTFVLCFEYPGGYRRSLFFRLLPFAFGAMVLVGAYGHGFGIVPATAVMTGAFFLCCMVCHGELARLRPHPHRLTGYYLMIALGGALGGVFVGLVAPHAFPYYFELPLGLAGCVFLTVIVLHRELPAARRRQGRRVVAGVAILLLVYLGLELRAATRDARVVARNFYGTIRVYDTPDPASRRRQMAHGAVIHGEQFLDAARRRRPTTYFGRQSGVGLLLAHVQERGPVRVGIIGLGAGVLATYGRPGDLMRFYEINPLVVDVARSEFTFLSDSGARVELVVADGRLALEREPAQAFDVLVLDAFSGDAIPMHLLTTEAFGIYFRHLAPDGIVAVNVTNRYLALFPVVAAAAAAWGRDAVSVMNVADPEQAVSDAHWVLIAKDSSGLGAAVAAARGSRATPGRGLPAWTDDYGNLFEILR